MKPTISTSANFSAFRGKTFDKVTIDEITKGKWEAWADINAISAPDGMDYDRYRRLKMMRINRMSVWDKQAVEISLTYMPTGTDSRSVLVSIEDAHASDIVMSRVINTLSLELETMIAVFSKLEEK